MMKSLLVLFSLAFAGAAFAETTPLAVDPELWQQLTQSLAKTPGWLETHVYIQNALTQVQQEAARKKALEETKAKKETK